VQESKLVLWEDRQALRILWLNREKALHALNKEMCVEIQDKLQ
jgi:enoyl-CoA hydratase/carnithine racemase